MKLGDSHLAGQTQSQATSVRLDMALRAVWCQDGVSRTAFDILSLLTHVVSVIPSLWHRCLTGSHSDSDTGPGSVDLQLIPYHTHIDFDIYFDMH